MPRRLLAAALSLLLLAACFGGTDPNVTESGEGKPTLSIEFPPTVEPESQEVATLRVENPGPGDMNSLQVSFVALGASDLPDPLVGFGAKGENPSIVSVDPEPRAVSIDGVVYTFDGLAEGESTEIVFTIRTPGFQGRFANSVIVADGSDPDRSRGVPLETRVEG
jgi:hypothetical protein